MTLPPAVRQQIADALESASVETLREDASLAVQLSLVGEYPAEEAMMRRLAALAIAVSEMQERALRTLREVDSHSGNVVRWSVDDVGDAIWMPEDPPACTLPAALAHLLREGA